MKTSLTLSNDSLIKRLDKKRSELGFSSRSNLVEIILKKGLDFLDNNTYDELLKISAVKNK